ncbi:MAG TPA: hypothetical protein VHO00_03210 [Actinomycetes bacterium]|nr:hypothetical protein [Actinomycetes bacterium]
MRGYSMSNKPRKRIWVQQVAVAALALETRLNIAAARGPLSPDQQATVDGIREMLARARDAAYRDDPRPSRWVNWWRGTLVDTAFQNLHAARAQIADLFDEAEVNSEIPRVLARLQSALHREDPRQVDAAVLAQLPLPERRAVLRRATEDGYDASDRQHERLRSFRNIVGLCALLIAVLVTITIALVANNPTWMPLCFETPTPSQPPLLNCPTASGVPEPQGSDIVVIALMGLLGGALAAAISIRNLRGTSTPYDVPVALAMLKVPLGAFTAIIGLVAIQGEFVPGLSALDSQEQILAYALILGFGQQVFTRTLDRRAQDLLEALPSKDATTAPVQPPVVVPELVPAPVPESSLLNGAGAAEGELVSVGAATAEGSALPNGTATADGLLSPDGGTVAEDGPDTEDALATGDTPATDEAEPDAAPSPPVPDSSDESDERLG